MAQNKKGPIPYSTLKGNISIPERLKVLDRKVLHAVLATEAHGQPYPSLVTYALLPNLKGVVFATPKRTFKYKNILKNSRVALLIDTRSNSDKDFLAAEAITLIGKARTVRRSKRWRELAELLIHKHPALSGFIKSPSTALILVDVNHCYHVSRFQTVSTWDLS